jgi:L-aminopeptidase/D-esterase-like protein
VVDAIVLAGGSAFGLASTDGVMSELRERGRGIATLAGPVPIVPAAIIYDLGVGEPVAPDAASGRAALRAAVPLAELPRGQVGVGTGATSAKLHTRPGQRGGVGIAAVASSAGSVHVLTVVNAAGVVVHPENGQAVLGEGADTRERLLSGSPDFGERQATTIGVVLVSAPVDETALIRCAVAAHDGIARAIRPAHTIFDGDVVFAVGLARGAPTPPQILVLSTAAELAMERAIVDAVTA